MDHTSLFYITKICFFTFSIITLTGCEQSDEANERKVNIGSQCAYISNAAKILTPSSGTKLGGGSFLRVNLRGGEYNLNETYQAFLIDAPNVKTDLQKYTNGEWERVLNAVGLDYFSPDYDKNGQIDNAKYFFRYYLLDKNKIRINRDLWHVNFVLFDKDIQQSGSICGDLFVLDDFLLAIPNSGVCDQRKDKGIVDFVNHSISGVRGTCNLEN